MTICGIDPGREKFGLAIVRDGELLLSAVVPTDELDAAASALASSALDTLSPHVCFGDPELIADIDAIVLGDGTASWRFADALARHGVRYETADEKNSTLEARELYWRLYPPKFPMSLIPTSLRLPPRPIDDLAAAVIAMRYERGRLR